MSNYSPKESTLVETSYILFWGYKVVQEEVEDNPPTHVNPYPLLHKRRGESVPFSVVFRTKRPIRPGTWTFGNPDSTSFLALIQNVTSYIQVMEDIHFHLDNWKDMVFSSCHWWSFFEISQQTLEPLFGLTCSLIWHTCGDLETHSCTPGSRSKVVHHSMTQEVVL